MISLMAATTSGRTGDAPNGVSVPETLITRRRPSLSKMSVTLCLVADRDRPSDAAAPSMRTARGRRAACALR